MIGCNLVNLILWDQISSLLGIQMLYCACLYVDSLSSVPESQTTIKSTVLAPPPAPQYGQAKKVMSSGPSAGNSLYTSEKVPSFSGVFWRLAFG